MKTRTRSTFNVLAILAVAALSGCGGVYDSNVTGVVSLDGKALPRGTVAFHPMKQGPQAYGLVRSDGSYSLMTGRERGLPAGEYTVTVVANEESVAKNDGRGGPPTPGVPITPPLYQSKNSSNVKFTVESGSNEIDLELTSETPPDWKPPGKRRRR